MTTIKALMESLKQYPNETSVCIAIGESIHLKEIEVGKTELPALAGAKDGNRDIIVLRTK